MTGRKSKKIFIGKASIRRRGEVYLDADAANPSVSRARTAWRIGMLNDGMTQFMAAYFNERAQAAAPEGHWAAGATRAPDQARRGRGSPCNFFCGHPLPSRQPFFAGDKPMSTAFAPFKRQLFNLAVGAAIVATATTAMGQAKGAKPLEGQVVKMAWIDPLSGLMAPVGNNQLKSWQFFAEKFSASNPAGVKFEIIGMDNKLSPTESLNALKSATDQGVRYIIQGNGSSVALALVDAIN